MAYIGGQISRGFRRIPRVAQDLLIKMSRMASLSMCFRWYLEENSGGPDRPQLTSSSSLPEPSHCSVYTQDAQRPASSTLTDARDYCEKLRDYSITLVEFWSFSCVLHLLLK